MPDRRPESRARPLNHISTALLTFEKPPEILVKRFASAAAQGIRAFADKQLSVFYHDDVVKIRSTSCKVGGEHDGGVLAVAAQDYIEYGIARRGVDSAQGFVQQVELGGS